MRYTSSEYGKLFEAVHKEALFDEILKNMAKKRIYFFGDTKEAFKSAAETFSSNLRSIVGDDFRLQRAYSLIENDARSFAKEIISKMTDESEKTYILFIYTEEGAAALKDPGAPNEFLNPFYEKQIETIGKLASRKENVAEEWMSFTEDTIKGSVGKSDMIIHYLKAGGSARSETELIVTDFSDYAEVIAKSLEDAVKDEEMDVRRVRGRYLIYSTRRLGSLVKRSTIIRDAVLGGNKSENFVRYVESLYRLKESERRAASALMSLFDKGMWKLIQAGSYAESYIRHLENIGVTEKKMIPSRVILFSKSSLFKYSVPLNTERHRSAIRKCRTIYGKSKKDHDYRDPLFLFEPIVKEIGKDENFAGEMHGFVRNAVVRRKGGVRREAFAFRGEDFVRLDMEFRKKHAEKIREALEETNLVFLTGSPGSGKTYAPRYGDARTPFLYFSSRTKINISALSTISEGAMEEMNAGSVIIIMDHKDINIKRGDETVHYIPLYIRAKEEKEKERITGLLNSLYEETALETDLKKNVGRIEFIDYSRKQTKRGSGYGGVSIENDDIRKKTVHRTSDQSVMKIASRAMETLGRAVESGRLEGYRVSYVGTVQSLEKAGKDAFLSFLKTVRDKISHPVVMFDEITGSSKNISFFKSVISSMGTAFSKTKVVVSDASLVSRDIVVETFCSRSIERRGKLFVEKIRERGEGPKIVMEKNRKIGNRLIEKFAIVEATAMPARNINLKTVFILDNGGGKNRWKRTVEILTKDVVETFSKEKKAFVYIQNKELIDLVDSMIEDISDETPRVLKITADHVSPETERRIKEGDYDIILATSSASRGLTFRDVTEYFILFQSFDVAGGLTEFEQVIVRGRGKGNDSETDKNYKVYFEYRFSALGEKKTDIVRIYSRMMTELFLTVKTFHLYSDYKKSMVKITPLPSVRNDGAGANIFRTALSNLNKEIEKIERERGKEEKRVRRLKEAVMDMIYTAFEITSGVDKLYVSKDGIREKHRGLSYSKYVFPYAISSINEHLRTVYSGEGSGIMSEKVEKINEILKECVRENIISRDRRAGVEKNLRFFTGRYDDKIFDKKSYIRVGTETFLFSSGEPDEVEIRAFDVVSSWGDDSGAAMRQKYERAKNEEERRRILFEIFYDFGVRYERLISDIFLLSRDSVISSFGIPDTRSETFLVRPKIHIEGVIQNESAISIFPFLPVFLAGYLNSP